MSDENGGRSQLRIHPSVIQQLGDGLITDEIQALIELVKNSYDADATYASIKIKTPTKKQLEDPENDFFGEITIEDNGLGMNIKNILSGWLYIAKRRKKDQKNKNKLTKMGRSPLGDKGLGRLGTQKIGTYLKVTTESELNPKYTFSIDWEKYLNAKRIEHVPIHIKKDKKENKTGTILTIKNLTDSQIWVGEYAHKRLEDAFTKMISPYIKIRKFIVHLEINGNPLTLTTIPDKLRDFAHIQYDIKYENQLLSVESKINKEWFKSKCQSKEKKQFDSIIHYEDFKKFLAKSPMYKQFNVTPIEDNDSNWLCTYSYQIDIKELDNIIYVGGDLLEERKIADPGPFESEIDYFDFNIEQDEYIDIFDKREDFKNAIKSLDGIRVFRDGFGVRTGADWLKLGEASTNQTYYSLRPGNTFGYISISSLNNRNLEETTSREQFKDTPYYRNFFNLLQSFRKFTDITNNYFGRQWVNYRNMVRENLSSNDLGDTTNVKVTIKKQTEKIKEQQEDLKRFKNEITKNIDDSINTFTTFTKKLEKKENISDNDKDTLKDTLSQLKLLINSAENIIPNIDKQSSELEKLNNYAEVVEDRFKHINDQLSDIFETASLGLVAESLSHEIYNITDQMILRTQQISSKISPNDIPLLTYKEYVRTTALGLKKQISYIDPSLKNVRDKKDIIDLSLFFKDLIDVQKGKLNKYKISIDLIDKYSNQKIKFNQGKLRQIFDNLINNSEYWLKKTNTSEKKIFIKINSHYNIEFWDSGKGIDPSVEHILFEPFVSMKFDPVTKTKGRGLGLYIIKQLLEYDSSKIKLLEDKNEFNRLYKFEINFKGASHE